METLYEDLVTLTEAIALLEDVNADPAAREFREYAPEAARKAGRKLTEGEIVLLDEAADVMHRHGWTGINGWPPGRGLYDGRDRIAAEEMQAALAHAERAELADNPGGDWITEAAGELGVDADAIRDLPEDEQALWGYRVWRKAWALRNADEAECERQNDR